MARRSRIFVPEVMQYVLLQTDGQELMFREKEDCDFFLVLIQELIKKYPLDIHAYTLLPTSFEFLATPKYEDNLAKFMQILARRYVLFYNKKYTHEGTLWRKRYTSLLVDDNYLYDVIKYIETKSLNLVENEKNYLFSSIGVNYKNKFDGIVVFHAKFVQEKYVKNYNSFLSTDVWDFIDKRIEKQYIIGEAKFIQNIEEILGVKLQIQPRGRPKKNNHKQRSSMYKKLVVLDKEKHKTLKLSPMEDLLFAKDTITLPLAYTEIDMVGKIYPVVFSGDDALSFYALVSLGETNLAISEDGKWIGEYVPMALKKYPFSLAPYSENKGRSLILVDEESRLVSRSKGRQLFKKSGESSDLLKDIVKLMSYYDNAIHQTQTLAKEIQESGILKKQEISLEHEGEKKVLVSGFGVVDQEKLAQLDKKILEKWEKNGVMKLIQIHLDSLKNVQTLFELAKNRQV